MNIITIEGRLGSGAPEIAKDIAEKLSYDYIDRIIMAEIAKKRSNGTGTPVTNTQFWQRLSVLPQVGGAEATLYLRGTGKIERVEYGTEYDTVAEVYDFMVSLGRLQVANGYDFGDYNDEIADVNDSLKSIEVSNSDESAQIALQLFSNIESFEINSPKRKTLQFFLRNSQTIAQ